MHLLLTDPSRHVRLFLSAADDKLSRREAELLRRVALSLRREPAALARYFDYVRPIALRRQEVEQANVQTNLRHINQQLTAADLPPLEAVAQYQPGWFVDVGYFFYGLNREY
ncbi:hypothetical protein [Hymenobacter sp. CRA2]|uniref:hypothetical protein n=1 Tax=Hymenobacter sp. CRA2 TaxID=1955620 RepID=UPI00098EEE5C|nr:hypothetical protein [Hymenobacter sp. CRA2]OON67167.1 hypothetical protein B0919_18740 [Hymenobacter sp. CRA2]